MAADTAHRSNPELLTLHAVRLKGLADDAEVASRFDLDRSQSDELLLDYEAYGWVTRSDFAGTTGWSMTAAGRHEDERRLADELQVTGNLAAVRDAYEEFLPYNARLIKACTDWQLRPTRDDPMAANDHTDIRWDQQVLAELATVGDELDAIGAALGTRLERFQGYERRFHVALTRALNGELAWVTRPRADSCHTVWMELHEDLLATLGVDRDSDNLGENDRRAPLP